MKKLRVSLGILCILLMLIPINMEGKRFARWFTSMGVFTADLRDEIVPITANNFISLTNSGFYDGLIFHRVVAGFVIQDGCPLGTGYGGPGYTIPDEFSPLLHHDSAGVLAMARTSQPNSAGSQYYITLAPTPHLDGNYAIFGKVFEGLDTVMAIGQVPVDNNDHPVNDVYIDSLRVLDLEIYNISPNPDSVVYYDTDDPFPFAVEAFNSDLSVQISWFIDDVLQPQETDIIFQPVFPSLGMHSVKCITATDEVSWTTEWEVNVYQGSGADDSSVTPAPELSIMSLKPNPFREKLQLDFSLLKAQTVQLEVYDLKGRLIHASAVQGKQGTNSWSWNPGNDTGSGLASGIYFLKVKTPQAGSVRKALYLK
ncbi:MAG: peptidylprolyl isomerase [Candidatus Cloacimonadaceae bacterium]